MAINITGANAYFAPGNHVSADLWSRFTTNHRTASIEQAKRMFSQELGPDFIDENEPAYRVGDRMRVEYAVYEQALWLLLGTQYGDGNNGDAVSILQGQNESAQAEANATRRERFSREALRWAGWGGITLVRG